MIADFFEVLLRFREGKYVLKGDIEEMYLQVKVNGKQIKFQKFIWRSVPEEPLKHFELNTVTFELAPSSFLATNTLLFATRKFAEQFSEAAKVIQSYFYVDDFVYSFDDTKLGLKLQKIYRKP